jgi:hypothetical protein
LRSRAPIRSNVILFRIAFGFFRCAGAVFADGSAPDVRASLAVTNGRIAP